MTSRQRPIPSLYRRHPGIPGVYAWGWLGVVTYQRRRRDGVGEGPEYFEERIVEESRRWGANLLEFYPPEMRRGFPLPWPEDDPLERPQGYWGGFRNPKWPVERMRAFFRYVHERGFLIHLFYHPGLIESAPPEELHAHRLRATEFVARLLHATRLYGRESCLDGFGYEWWLEDLRGEMNGILWRYDPGAYVTSTQAVPAPAPNFGQGIACALGRFGTVCGVSDRWRPRFTGPWYRSHQLDCRVRKNSLRDWDYWGRFGGGSYPDWMMRQLHDFLRERSDLGTGVWWLGEPEATLPAEYRPYVYGLTQDPIRVAVATSLYATGRGGYREIVADAEGSRPEGFGQDDERPYQSSIVQNNYLRLVRSQTGDGGVLVYDPSHAAHYDAHHGVHDPLLLSGNAFSSALEGEPEDPLQTEAGEAEAAWELRIGSRDLEDCEFRQAGGYEPLLRFDAGAEDSSAFPARLVYEGDPDWPGELELAFEAPEGTYELVVWQLRLRQGFFVEPDGPVEVHLDGRPAGLFRTRSRGGEDRVLLSTTRSGGHRLRIVPVKESAMRLDALLLRRLAPSAVSHRCVEPAGALAVLEEQIVTQRRHAVLREERRWTMVSDTPWVRVRIDRRLQGSSLPVRTVLGAAGYDVLRVGRASLRAAARVAPSSALWTLHDTSGTRVDLHLLAGSWGATRHLDWQPCCSLSIVGDERQSDSLDLALAVAVEPYLGSFDSGDGGAALRGAVFSDPIPPSADGVVANALAIPRVAVARLRRPGPFLVREEGGGRSGPWWYSRGAQASSEEPGTSLLKLYLQPGGEAKVLVADFIGGRVRPGWGCQNALAIRAQGLESSACEVEVLKTSYLVFAPRLEFPWSIRAARVNGRMWRYFEDRVLFLPNAKGRYGVEVEAGTANEPCLCRSWLNVHECSWDAGERILTIVGEHAEEFRGELPGGGCYTAEVRTAGLRVAGVDNGGSIVPDASYTVRREEASVMGKRAIVLRLYPGVTKVRLAEGRGDPPPLRS